MSIPEPTGALLRARRLDRAQPHSHDHPVRDRGGRYSRYRLTINTGTAVAKFHDKRDILSARDRINQAVKLVLSHIARRERLLPWASKFDHVPAAVVVGKLWGVP
jgi:hypothetical protein